MTESAERRVGLDARKRELLAMLAREKGLDPYQLPIPARGGSRSIPLSFAQERLWVLEQIEPGSPVYNEPYRARLSGALDLPALTVSLQEIVRRHEALRTTFPDLDGCPVQVISSPARLIVPLIDLRGLDALVREAEAGRLAAAQARHPFDLARGPLLRAALVRLRGEEHELLLNLHHIVCDATSIGILAREMALLYGAFASGSSAQLPALPIQYADFALWQREWFGDAVLGRQLEYWRTRLAGAPAILDLPTDRPRPTDHTASGRETPFSLAPDLSDALKALAQRRSVTLFMLLLACFDALLLRYTGQEDILVGTPIANRNRTELKDLIGFFVNTLVLRTDLSGNPSFEELLDRVHKAALGAFDHQDLPFAKVVEELHPERSPGHPPLIQIVFMVQRGASEVRTNQGMRFNLKRLETRTTKFDLTLNLVAKSAGIGGLWEYNSELFFDTTIRRMQHHFAVLVAGAAAAPERRLWDLPLLAPAEHAQLAREWNDTRREPSADIAIHELFEAQAAQAPRSVALELEGSRLTYEDLDSRANRVARHLRSLGVRPGTPVGICMERSLGLVVGLLGILKAGGAYLPLDPDYPPERLAFMLKDAGAAVLLTQQRLRDRLPATTARLVFLDEEWEAISRLDADSPAVPVRPDDLAYLIYTSGSTGLPKGVLIAHRGVVNQLRWRQDRYPLTAADRVLQTDSFSFDASVWQFFWPLSTGARLVLTAPGGNRDSAYLVRLMAEQGVTVVGLVPSMLQFVLDEPGLAGCGSLRHVFCGGEGLSIELAGRFLASLPKAALHNVYGPTEASIDASDATYRSGEPLPVGRVAPIGRPLANQRVFVLDRELRPTGIGMPGELYVAGRGLARGYHARPELTAERFLPGCVAEEPGERLYRTGDRVRWLPDGTLEFLGRVDHQVKIRGFRIELGEIESALVRHPEVRDAVVVAREDAADARLVAYLVAAGESSPTTGELREFLKRSLPEHMVPSAFVFLPALPMTPNGKLDRRALPAPLAAKAQTGEGYVPPRNEFQRLIAELWREVLGLEQVGVHDNFFDLGGHSLLLIQLQNRLRKAIGREIPVLELFRHTTISSLAEFLDPRPEIPSPDHRREPQPALDPSARAGSEIAIVGMSGRFPGARSVDEFWRNLCAGAEGIRFFSEEELLAAGISATLLSDPAYVRANGVLDDVELFDAAFFGFSPREAQVLDPQHRLFLECAWEALEHAGYDAERYRGAIGVFAGMGMNTYVLNNVYANPHLVQAIGSFQTALGNDKDFLPTRVSYKLNLRGPSMVVQTACSTSLVAAHVARWSLLNGECDIALAGGASINVPQTRGYLYQDGGIFSPDGHCRAFDADAKGTVAASGVAIVVLKRLADALADGDSIYAVVKGSAINNDGHRKIGYTAPSLQGQLAVIRKALSQADVVPESIEYIETHGTGTTLGDLVEIGALTEAFRPLTDKRHFCALGSVKTNVGHLDTAAGAAGLIKTALALHHRVVPPSLHFKQPNPRLHLDNSPFYVNTELMPWTSASGTPRRAGVSSFGIGGTNAHLILEEAPAAERAPDPWPEHLLLLSARTDSALDRATDRLASYLEERPDVPLADVAYTLQVGRKAFDHRRMVVCAEPVEAVEKLREREPGRVATALRDPAVEAPVVFMFPGGGAQHLDMGLAIYQLEPTFRSEVDRCAQLLEPHLGLDLRDLLYPAAERRAAAAARARRTAAGLPALFTVEYALAKLWMSWGVSPQALIGHSLGEYVAACLAGVISLEDALALVALRGRLFETLPQGAMLSVPLPEKELRPQLRQGLSIAAVNLPFHCVVSGPVEALDALAASLGAEGVDCRRIHIEVAAHSEMVDAILGEFGRFAAALPLRPPSIPYVSNLTGSWITDEQATDPTYWTRHLRQTVRFAEGVRELLKRPERLLLEVGPGRTLSTLAKRHPDRPAEQIVLSSLRHPDDEETDRRVLLNALGRLWLAGVEVDWTAVHAGRPHGRLPLPTYPFERQRYWAEPRSPGSRGVVGAKGPRGRQDSRDWFYVPSWTRTSPPLAELRDATGTTDDWLVFSDGGGLLAKLVERLEAAGRTVITVLPGHDFGLSGEVCTVRPEEPGDYHALLADLARRGVVPARILHAWSFTRETPRDGQTAFDRVQELGLASVLALHQALAQRGLTPPAGVHLLSNHLQEVTGDEELCPAKATILALCDLVAAERSGLSCRSIDVVLPEVGSRHEEQLLEWLIAEVAGCSREPMVAYRGLHRWVRSLVAKRGEIERPLGVREDGAYLVAGAASRLGARAAELLARSSRANLVLPVPFAYPADAERGTWAMEHGPDDQVSRVIALVERLERLGSQVLVVTGGREDPDWLRQVLARAHARFGAIRGAVCAAGPAELDDQAGARWLELLRLRSGEPLAWYEALADDRDLEVFVSLASLRSGLDPAGRVADRAARHFAHVHACRRNRSGDGPWIDLLWDESLATAEAVQDGPAPAEEVTAFRRALSLGREAQVLVSSLEPAARVLAWGEPALGQESARAGKSTPTHVLHPRPRLDAAYVPPRNELERALAEVWSDVLGVEQVGIHDTFQALGGDSVLAIAAVSKARERGIPINHRKAYLHPTIAELVLSIDAASDINAKQGLVTGPANMTPIQHWFFGLDLPEPHHWNTDAMFSVREDLAPTLLESALRHLLLHHDALRARFHREEGRWQQVIADPDDADVFVRIDLTALPEARWRQALETAASTLQTTLDLVDGPLVRSAAFVLGGGQPTRLLLVIHHLAVDAVSWRILVEDLETACLQMGRGEPVVLPLKTSSFEYWGLRLVEHARSGTTEAELGYWLSEPRQRVRRLPVDFLEGTNAVSSIRRIEATLPLTETEALLRQLQQVCQADVNDALLTALAAACREWTGEGALLADVEGHGREPIFKDVDVSRTVGWFTSLYPVLLELGSGPEDPLLELQAIQRQLRGVPGRGLGHGLLRYLGRTEEIQSRMAAAPRADLIFRYLGQEGSGAGRSTLFAPAQESKGPAWSPRGLKQHRLDIGARIAGGRLHVNFAYSENLYRRATVEELSRGFLRALQTLLARAVDAPPAVAGSNEE